MDPQPLLSICITTYNAAHLLRVTLAAVLPQVAAANGRAEVLVVDDVSSDDTPAVIEEARRLGPVRYIRNERNLGSSANLVNGPVRHAAGEFVWAWNQHCLLRPGGLARVLAVLEQQRHLDILYINFRCARYPEQWPAAAAGGYDGPADYPGNPELEDRGLPAWHELVESRTGICTQSYAHLVKRAVWTSYWADREVGVSYRDAPSTYPHTWMLAHTVFPRPSHYVGEPALTIYNGAQSWGDLKSRAKVYMLGYPDLLRAFGRQGLPAGRLAEAQRWGAAQAGTLLREALRDGRRDVLAMFPRYVLRFATNRGVIPALWQAFIESRCCWPARALAAADKRLAAAREYAFRNCRPARWIRSRLETRSRG